MNKAEQLRKSLVAVLTIRDSVVELDTVTGVDDDDDLERLIIDLESYIKKYPRCGLRLDYNTARLHKSKNIQIISSYVNSLSASRFEKYSALLIKIFDFEITHATKSSHDQGIDFIGIKSFKLFDSKRKSYLVGQAKKYNSLVDLNEVRGFAGAIMLLRGREFSQEKEVYKSIIMRSFTSVEGIFITSYFFSPPALKLCENSDIISLDFVDIVLLTENAIMTKSLNIETNDKFVKVKTDRELDKIQILKCPPPSSASM
ncbi:hypothetical protein BH09BAC1_BH09BAC1_07300 [soil metagenome]